MTAPLKRCLLAVSRTREISSTSLSLSRSQPKIQTKRSANRSAAVSGKIKRQTQAKQMICLIGKKCAKPCPSGDRRQEAGWHLSFSLQQDGKPEKLSQLKTGPLRLR